MCQTHEGGSRWRESCGTNAPIPNAIVSLKEIHHGVLPAQQKIPENCTLQSRRLSSGFGQIYSRSGQNSLQNSTIPLRRSGEKNKRWQYPLLGKSRRSKLYRYSLGQLFSLIHLWYRIGMKTSHISRKVQDVRRRTSNISSNISNHAYFLKEMQWLLEGKYKGHLTVAAEKDIALLKKGEHVDYVIGFVDFLGCKIDLSLRPFIPRPETEYWVEQAIQEVQNRNNCKENVTATCLDIFSGSGCIGIAILKHIPQAVVDFGEKDKRLFSQLRLNAKKNGIEKKRYRVIQSDVFSNIKGKYDYIFANPPYLAESRKNKVQASVLRNEPKEALFAGKGGLDVIRLFLSRAKDFLAPEGKIYMEFDSFQKKAIERLLKKYGYQYWQFFKDQYGRWRWVKIVYNGKNGSCQRTPSISKG